MLSNARTAVKFLVYGLLIGLLFAPRSGRETRQEVMSWVGETIQDTVKTVTGASGASSTNSGDTQPMDNQG